MEYAPPEHLQPSNSHRLWIVVGSLIGVLVIVMGGCVACGALVGLSALSNQDTTSNSKGTRGSKGSSGWGFGSGLGVTSWSGKLSCDDNSEEDYGFKFASSGNPLYSYQTSSGLREIELEGAGQNFKFAAAGGGATYINVESFQANSDGVEYTIRISHERATGGTMIQSRRMISIRAVLSGSNLVVDASISSSSAASQPGYVIPDESVSKCHAEMSKD